MFSTGAAQRRMSPAPVGPPVFVVEPLSGTYNISVDAFELSRGDIDLASGTTYGWTWSGKTSGDLSGFMFVSLNYDAAAAAVGVDVLPDGASSNVTGGSWTKLIFMKGEYAGSVSGRIVNGQLTWNEKAQNTTISLFLTSDQGTEAFVGNTGKGTFDGILDQTGKVSTMSGVLTMDY